MKMQTLQERLGLKPVCGNAVSFHGVYAGDLLSRAMSHVEAENLWITIMNNMNVIAVASLTEAAAVLLAEGVSLMPDAAQAAQEKGICVLSSEKTVYELCAAISAMPDLDD